METKKLLKSLKCRLGLITAVLAMLAVSQGMYAATTTYYYRGSDNSWGATAMTASSDGYYCYKSSSSNANQFKIAKSTSGWDYNCSKVSKNFNRTDVGNIGDYGGDNCYCWQSGTYYIILYYPNTSVNSSSDPKICAATKLPDDFNVSVKSDMTVGSKGTVYVGSKISKGSSDGWWYNYQVGLASWNSSKVFIGTTQASADEISATYYDKEGDNSKLHADLDGYQFKSAGTYYAWGGVQVDSKAKYACTTGTGWTTSTTPTLNTSSQIYWTVNPVPKPSACVATVTNAASGTGTSSDPYIVRPGESYTVKLTATAADASLTGYGWNINSSSSKASSSTTNTYTKAYTAGTAGSSAEYTGYAWHYNGSTSYYSSTYATSSKIYVSVQAACTDPTVTTTAATNIGTTTATLGGSYSGGSATPTEVGIEWTDGKSGSIAASSVTTPFTVSATGLTAGTTYKYKAYAVACGGNKVYGTEQTFKTSCTATKPSVSTVAATGVGTNVATVGCNVTNAGVKADCSAETITARGIEWTQGKSGQESIGSGTGSSTKQITGLTPGTEYKYKAFATNANGTTYGEVKTFTTTCPTPGKPSLTCTSDNNRVLPGTKAAFTVATESGATYQLYANSAATGSSVTGDGTTKTLTSGADMGSSDVTYYVKACSNVASCTSSCNQSENLVVKPLTIWVRGDAVGSWDNGTQMTQNGQVFSLEFTDNGDNKEFKYLYKNEWSDESEAIYNDPDYSKGTDAGVSWTFGTVGDDNKRGNSKSGTISSGYEAPKTLYINPITKKVWIEAVAKSCEPPSSVTTAAASNIKSTSATLGGSYTGGSGTPTEVGIEWVSGTGKSGQEAASMGSSFSINVTGLSAGTTYTYKAYAKACETIVYGTTQTLTTCAVPVMAQATRKTDDYGSDYLKLNVKATTLGCAVTEWGVNVYSNSGCTSLVKSVQGAGSLTTSNQVVNITGLTSNTPYYVKSYAKYDGGDNTVEAANGTIWQTKIALGETSSSSVTSNSATLSSSTVLGGSAKTAMTALFRYSTSAGSIASGATIASSQTQVGQTISANLTGLTSSTTYYYRVEVTYKELGTGSNVTIIGETKSFTTLGVHGDITGLPASPVAKCSGETLQLAPQCSTATSWSYNSDATGVATVSGTGLITAVGAGSAVITVTAKADNYIDKSVQITVNVSASPAVSASATNTTAYEVITLTSTSGSVTWSKSDAAAYFVKDNQAVDGDTVDAVSVNFKAPAKNSAYTVGATSNGCTSNLNITIGEPQEVCN